MSRAVVILSLVAVAAFGAGCGDLSRAELKRGVESLGALAAEGRLLARDVAADRTKATFARVHARTLSEDATHEAEKLGDATPAPGLHAARARAVKLAEMLGDTLGALAIAPGDEADAHARLAELAATAHRIDDLKSGL